MSYLNRTNNYGVRTKMLIRRVPIANTYVTQPWWVDCPVCPASRGFGKFKTHAAALRTALAHIKWEHGPRTFVERAS